MKQLPLIPCYLFGFVLGVGIGAAWDITEFAAGIYVRHAWSRHSF